MGELGLAQFVDFFSALHNGSSPFPWQERLAQRVAAPQGQGWPGTIALPTASGKTACIDVAIFTLAAQSHLPPQERSAPRRIFFVVDRRIIVDEAYARAARIAVQLRDAKSGILRDIADRLRTVSGCDIPLACVQLRGGIYRDQHWARSPAQPTVICSTVDQIGSRLLFRGYGVSFRSWPTHAALTANDALILLDEAHCSEPFHQTLEGIARYRDPKWAQRPLLLPFRPVIMTATPGTEARDVFRGDEADWEHLILGPRVKAPKPVELVETADVVREIDKQIQRLARAGSMALAVLVNRVRLAKEVYEKLRGHFGDEGVVLLTGRMRPIDRDRVVKTQLGNLHSSQSANRSLTNPKIVVATQCLEVGADLDFDAMVCQCASLDALRQRFGRLNRMGRDIPARGVIVAGTGDIKEDDPIYGSALRETWKWLISRAKSIAVEACEGGRRKKKAEKQSLGWLDFGIAAMAAKMPEGEAMAAISTARRDAPVMLPAHVDCWAQTSPEPVPSPDVGLFLHGASDYPANVQVCWRADLEVFAGESEANIKDNWIDAVEAVPPTSAECMPVPLWDLARWINQARPDTAASDLESAGAADCTDKGGESVPNGPSRRVLLWRGPDESIVLTGQNTDLLRPGDTVVIPAHARGWDVLGHIPDEEAGNVDRGDVCSLVARGTPVLRVTKGLAEKWGTGPALGRLSAFADCSELPEDWADLCETLRGVASSRDVPNWLRLTANNLADEKSLERLTMLHPQGGLVLRSFRRSSPDQIRLIAAELFLEPDEQSELAPEADAGDASARAIPLADHSRAVGEKAAEFARLCGIPRELVPLCKLAGDWHDLGKADPRFQAWLHGGSRSLAAAGANLLAKSPSVAPSRKARRSARIQAGFPEGGRHELLSVRLAESWPAGVPSMADKDLLLHLIAAHHGHCRPFAPWADDPEPVSVALALGGRTFSAASTATGLERLDSGVAERFWVLTERYGWWGIAYLEAMLVLADRWVSSREQDQERATNVGTG